MRRGKPRGIRTSGAGSVGSAGGGESKSPVASPRDTYVGSLGAHNVHTGVAHSSGGGLGKVGEAAGGGAVGGEGGGARRRGGSPSGGSPSTSASSSRSSGSPVGGGQPSTLGGGSGGGGSGDVGGGGGSGDGVRRAVDGEIGAAVVIFGKGYGIVDTEVDTEIDDSGRGGGGSGGGGGGCCGDEGEDGGESSRGFAFSSHTLLEGGGDCGEGGEEAKAAKQDTVDHKRVASLARRESVTRSVDGAVGFAHTLGRERPCIRAAMAPQLLVQMDDRGGLWTSGMPGDGRLGHGKKIKEKKKTQKRIRERGSPVCCCL
jgi:hypothetical protein